MNRMLLMIGSVVLSLSAGCESATSGNGGSDCELQDLADECCSVPDHQPCKGLSLDDCNARSYCKPVKGAPWTDHSAPESYLGCTSLCGGMYTAASTCLYDPADPASCYWNITGRIPDGWVELPECEVPSGVCGM